MFSSHVLPSPLRQGLRTWRQVLLGTLLASGSWALHADNDPLPLTELRTFVDVFHQIRANYVDEVDDKTLLENAIRGMLEGLDPHSAFLDIEAFDNLQVNTSGEFGGLGLEVGLENGFVKVIAPIDDTPASRAGLQSGDLIIELDGKPVKGLSLDEAVELMRGTIGSEITLTVVRDDGKGPQPISLVRDAIKVVSVRSKELAPGYGYLRIAQFQANTGKDVRSALEKLSRERPLEGLVLDLRNNPGGVLQASVEVADAFLDSGLVVYTEGRLSESHTEFHASPGDRLAAAPLVVLINGGSASASEIVAGALQDHRRAVIMGTGSFGKGSVQTVLPLTESRAIKLTTALYYTPSGRSIQAQGIEPDVWVDRAKVEALHLQEEFHESDLRGHLRNGNGGNEGRSDVETPLYQQDNQVYEALTLLKGVNILRQPSALSSHEAP